MSATSQPGDALHVNQRVDDTAVIVQVVGEVDEHAAPVLTTHLAQALAAATPPTQVIADLRETKFYGSKGLAALVTAHQQSQKQHISLRVVAGPSLTKRLELVGLLNVLNVYPTLTEAMQETASETPRAIPCRRQQDGHQAANDPS